jgi:replicative DNA helicase
MKRGAKGGWVEMTSEEARPLMSDPGRVDVRLVIEKNRHGPVGQVPLLMDWVHGGRFSDRDEGED